MNFNLKLKKNPDIPENRHKKKLVRENNGRDRRQT